MNFVTTVCGHEVMTCQYLVVWRCWLFMMVELYSTQWDFDDIKGRLADDEDIEVFRRCPMSDFGVLMVHVILSFLV